MSEDQKSKKLSRFEKLQGLVTIVLSLATAILAWKTFDLNERTSSSDILIREIEARLEEQRLGFDRIRDVYDRTAKYLASNQDERGGRALVALISSIPESTIRAELLSVISAKATVEPVAAEAAEIYVGSKLTTASANNSEFIGELMLEFVDEKGTAILKQDFGFKDSKGLVWTAPAGSMTDGASIPASLQSILGTPFDGQLRKAAVIHDYYSTTRERSYESTQTMFYEALLASGFSKIKAKIFYAALQLTGPRWEDP